MSSSIGFGGAGCASRLNLDSSSSKFIARFPNSVPMKKSRSGFKATMSAKTELSRVGCHNDGVSTKIDHEKMDEWMPEAVVEIVKNLKQAPLLMQVYDKGEKRSSARLKTERAVEEEWEAVKESWNCNESPEGVILVEEIEEREEEEEDGASKAWGIVIQGKGCEYGPACYLLKTSRVRSGVGSACTHFCLTKVTSFRESAASQLRNCWLLQPHMLK